MEVYMQYQLKRALLHWWAGIYSSPIFHLIQHIQEALLRVLAEIASHGYFTEQNGTLGKHGTAM